MNAQQKEQVETIDVQQAYVLNLSTMRLSPTQIKEMAESEMDEHIGTIQEKLGVRTGDHAANFFSSGEFQAQIEAYINSEKDSLLAELLTDYDQEDHQEKLDKLNKLVFVQLAGSQRQIVGPINDVLKELATSLGIEYNLEDNTLCVSRKANDGTYQVLYERSCVDLQDWSAEDAVHLVESSVITEQILNTQMMWELGRLNSQKDELPYMDYLLQSKTWVTEHELFEHGGKGSAKLYVYENVLQRVSTAMLEDKNRLEILSKISGERGKKVPMVTCHVQPKLMDLTKLNLDQQVYIVQSCIEAKEVVFVGNGLDLLKASVAGSVQDFDDVAFAIQQVLDPSIVSAEALASTPTVNLDW